MNFDHAIVSAALVSSRITDKGEDELFKSGITPYIVKTSSQGSQGMHIHSCLLCNEAGIGGHFLECQHLRSNEHRGNLLALRDDIERVKISSERFCRLFAKPVDKTMALLDEIVDPNWKDSIEAELYRYLAANSRPATQEIEALERPLKKLKMFEHCERLVILRLAVWRAECQRQMPDMTHGNLVACLDWIKAGWKGIKKEQQSSNAMNIVAIAVRSFLH
jgi:hypothetical protein